MDEDLLEHIFYSTNAPRIDIRGTRIINVPSRFKFIDLGDNTCCLIEVLYTTETYYDANEKSQRSIRFETRGTSIYLSHKEIEFALEHKQFARIGTEDSLEKIDRPKRSKKTKNNNKSPAQLM